MAKSRPRRCWHCRPDPPISDKRWVKVFSGEGVTYSTRSIKNVDATIIQDNLATLNGRCAGGIFDCQPILPTETNAPGNENKYAGENACGKDPSPHPSSNASEARTHGQASVLFVLTRLPHSGQMPEGLPVRLSLQE